MCSLQEHIEREIRARKAQSILTETETSTADKGGFFMAGDRRWKYIGAETHYGYRYHLWENAVTKRRFAWEANAYRRETTKETA